MSNTFDMSSGIYAVVLSCDFFMLNPVVNVLLSVLLWWSALF